MSVALKYLATNRSVPHPVRKWRRSLCNADCPDAYAMNLTSGILRVRYRDSWEAPTLLQPGQVYAIRIELFPCSN